MRITIALIALVAVSGCSLAPLAAQVRASIDQGIESAVEDRMHYNDQKGELIMALPCDISVGAYYRMKNPNHQKAIGLLCSPAGEPLPTTTE